MYLHQPFPLQASVASQGRVVIFMIKQLEPARIANQNLTPAESNTTTESFFSPECSECKPKLIKTTNQNKGNILTSQSELEVNIRNWLQARKNAGDQVSAGWVVRVS